MLLTKEVEMTWTNNRKIYEPLGYKYTKQGEKFIVKIEDLATNSGQWVELKCDYCGAIKPIRYVTYNRQRDNCSTKKDCCTDCKHLKIKETAMNEHGHKHSRQKHINVENLKIRFKNRGYIPLFEKYINNREYLEYICEKHRDKGILKISYSNFDKGRGCKYCGAENRKSSRRIYNIYTIRKEFKERGYTLNSNIFTSLDENLFYTCDKHPNYGEQSVTYYGFKKATHNCKECYAENSKGSNSAHWKGGLTPLYNALRKHITPWIEDSKNKSKRKCVLTGKRSSLVHHLYSFNTILLETLEILNIKWDKKIGIKLEDLSDELTELIKIKFLGLHYNYGLGVCVSKRYHILFHKLYGAGNNTPEQFEEFKQRYLSGEFTETEQLEQTQIA